MLHLPSSKTQIGTNSKRNLVRIIPTFGADMIAFDAYDSALEIEGEFAALCLYRKDESETVVHNVRNISTHV